MNAEQEIAHETAKLIASRALRIASHYRAMANTFLALDEREARFYLSIAETIDTVMIDGLCIGEATHASRAAQEIVKAELVRVGVRGSRLMM